ncbi:hypothetical protein CONPUDRAFT_161708 [Coniophora puteana RWD-64-598 SS2]|uniref:Uncharacterized protein n=1 Tax=Coniophora puteana (strain RWD-64-598) TaxID=741705 RepID=A0A5M3N736_CONPW|nr:uncharacterized protein CONPUDRAFT_161708 [Coniophora puteana RWD-64-598 SS2]EIW87098.1 hypothetical protein CONPUDRAFT_161708 [Coniophora puteana RWD-64-598 SS2]
MLTASMRPPSGGWYTRPQYSMQRRGRSRQVSAAALARQASEERRATLLSEKHCIWEEHTQSSTLPTGDHPCHTPTQQQAPLDTQGSLTAPQIPSRSPSPVAAPSPEPSTSSSSSMSTDLYEYSPPSPPCLLEDQIQVAYALDDIRLAKILLLKLKGIEVTSDTDPRIDEVRDEDFDICFAPSGPLKLDEEDQRRMEENQRQQQRDWEEHQRMQRLMTCGRKWESETFRFHNDRLRAIQRREEARAVAEERRRAEMAMRQRQAEQASRRRYQQCVKRETEPFQYSFMAPTPSSARGHIRSNSAAERVEKATKLFQSSVNTSRRVSFQDVVHSMEGSLFPLDPAERIEQNRRLSGASTVTSATRQGRKSVVCTELLDTLLKVVEWEDGERRRMKGKGKDGGNRPIPGKVTRTNSTPVCSICASSFSESGTSSSATTRSESSWFSFGSPRSRTSISTAATTPATSPTPSMRPSFSKMASQLTAPAPLVSIPEIMPCRHYVGKALVAVPLQDSPLAPEEPKRQIADATSHCSALGAESLHPDFAVSASVRGKTFARRFSDSVLSFVNAACGLQTAYIAAISIGASSDPFAEDNDDSQVVPAMKPRVEGYRALACDVKTFTAPAPITEVVEETFDSIALVSPFPPPAPAWNPPPSQRCSPHSPIILSPLRSRTPPPELVFRMRPIANPALLRLKALQNIMCSHGLPWEGRGRDGGMSCGRDRLYSMAFEGRGRSQLGCEVQLIVA